MDFIFCINLRLFLLHQESAFAQSNENGIVFVMDDG